jgi:hypothetical protein
MLGFLILGYREKTGHMPFRASVLSMDSEISSGHEEGAEKKPPGVASTGIREVPE